MGFFDTKTALDIITDAGVMMGEFGAGEPISAEDADFGLTRLNSMLDSWATEGLSSFTTNVFTGPLVAGKQDYLMGQDTSIVTPDFSAQRPVLIQTCSFVVPLPGSTLEFPMSILDSNRWLAIRERSKPGYVAEDVYVDQMYPNTGVHINPVPLAWPAYGVGSIRMSYWSILMQFATIADLFSFPPGYYKAIITNLAVEMCSGYMRPVDPNLDRQAQQGKNFIQQLNAQVQASFGENRTLNAPHLGKVIAPTPGGQ